MSQKARKTHNSQESSLTMHNIWPS